MRGPASLSWSSRLLAGALVVLGACTDAVPSDPVFIASVDVTPKLNSARVGATQQLAAVAKDAAGNPVSGQTITWRSSEPTVATVSDAGLVTFVGTGSTAIIAKAGSASGFATILSEANVASVAMSSASVTLPYGQATQLTATPLDAKGVALFRPITWASSNPAVATVSSTGVVTSVAAGTTTISATSENKVGATSVTVTPPAPVASVTLSLTSGFMPTGVAVPLVATLKDASGGTLTDRLVAWTVSDATKGAVASSGNYTANLTASAVGTFNVTATVEGKSATATFMSRTGVKNATPLTFANAAAGTGTQFAFYVPAGTTKIVVTLAGGTGDPDLYLYRPGSTLAADDCHSWNDGPGESCTVTAPGAGVWLIYVDAYTAHANTVITATTTP